MKILMASTPATGHLNPLIAVATFLAEDGHEVHFLSATASRARIEKSGAIFRALPGEADVDLNDLHAVAPELKTIEPGLDWLRVAVERIFIDKISDQHKGLREALKEFPADAIIVDDMFFGIVPLLLGPRAKRPAIVACGTSILHWRREDKAPLFIGLPPAETPAQFKEYEGIAKQYHDRAHAQGQEGQRFGKRKPKLGADKAGGPQHDEQARRREHDEVLHSARHERGHPELPNAGTNPRVADHGYARLEPRMRPSYRVKRADWKGLGCENHQCPLWVKSRHRKGSAECPLYPQKRTSAECVGMSALCQ